MLSNASEHCAQASIAELLIIEDGVFSKKFGSIIATFAKRSSSWKLCFLLLTLSTEIRVTSLPLPNVVGISIYDFFSLFATNFATSNELPPPIPITQEKF